MRLLWEAGPRELATVVALEVLAAGLLAAGLVLGRDMLDGVLAADRSGGGWGGFVWLLVGLVLVAAALSVVQAVVERHHQMLAELTACHAQARILDVACAVELSAYDDSDFHDRVARAHAGAQRSSTVVHAMLGLLRSAAGVMGSAVALAALQPLLLLMALPTLGAALLLSGRRARAFYAFAYGMTSRDRERTYIAGLLTERDPAKEVRAMDLAGFLRARHDRLYRERIAELRAVSNRQLRLSLISGLGTSAVVAAALVLLVALALGDHVSLADAASASAAMILLGMRLAVGAFTGERLLESAMFIEDYLAFGAVLVASAPGHNGGPPAVAPRSVSAEGVWFTYPGSSRPALRDVSLRIEPGEVVALVGANGSGKTTLAKLLGALYVPDRGRVLLGGADTARGNRPRLRRDIGVIFQDFVRYQLPARDNIALGRHERYADESAIRAAAQRAGVDPDLSALRDGYATQLGPAFAGGVDLSLGQWQKVAVARLFFRDAPFVILDEPTAALDAQAEHELFAGIRELFARRSVLLISHRFSTVREADRICVLDGGRVTQFGSHDELMAQGGAYAALFTLQASAYATA